MLSGFMASEDSPGSGLSGYNVYGSGNSHTGRRSYT